MMCVSNCQLAMAQRDVLAWFEEIPFVSKVYLTTSLAVTTACFLDFVSPLTLYYNFDLIFQKGQYWRLLTSYFFFGTFSLDFLFHVYFVIRYCRLLEEGIFRGRTADMIVMLLFGASLITCLTSTIHLFTKIKFLGQPLAFMMVYIWGRSPENADVRMGLLGIFPFSAPYLPWILLLFSFFLGNPIETDLLGIIVGHVYYFLEFVYPVVADLRGWRTKRILCTPSFLHYAFGSDNIHGYGGMFAPAVRVWFLHLSRRFLDLSTGCTTSTRCP
jgi:Derlin-2/3